MCTPARIAATYRPTCAPRTDQPSITARPSVSDRMAAPPEIPMIDHIQEVHVSLNSPLGSVFRGFSRAVVLKAKKQVIIEFRRNAVNYVSLSEQAELTVEDGLNCRRFLLKNAMARLDKDKLSILAETITPNKKTSSAE